METVVGLFETLKGADRALHALKDAGFAEDQVGVLAHEAVITRQDVDAEPHVHVDKKGAAESAGAAAVGGGIFGGIVGLLVGVGAVAIPGVGPIVAAGTIGSALTAAAAGAGIGAATGGILGALAGLDLSEEERNVYAEGIRQGGILIVAQAEHQQAEEARQIFAQSGAIDVHETYEALQAGGWEGFRKEQDRDIDLGPLAWGRLQDQR